MTARYRHARLTLDVVEELAQSLVRLDRIHDAIQATGMAGKLAMMELCVEVYRSIECAVRLERAGYQRWMIATGQVPPDPAQGEASPEERAADALAELPEEVPDDE